MTKHSTSTIVRPPGACDDSGDSARPPRRNEPGDHTRLIQRRRNRQFFGIGTLFIVIAIVGALLVLPLRAWQDQRAELAARQRELAALEIANNRLAAENDRLSLIEGIEEAARRDYAFRSTDEVVIGMLPPTPPSANFPPGWPYSVVSEIFATRLDLAAAEAAAAASTPPPPVVESVPVSVAIDAPVDAVDPVDPPAAVDPVAAPAPTG